MSVQTEISDGLTAEGSEASLARLETLQSTTVERTIHW